MVDRVFAEIALPPDDLSWKEAIHHRTASARAVLARHPWATPMMESRRSPGSATLRHHDAVLGCFRRGGLSWPMTAHGYAAVDAFLYGFALQQAALPATTGDEMADLAEEIVGGLEAADLPHLAGFTAEHVMRPGYDFGDEFEFGLDLILDGLEAAARRDGT